MGALFQGKGAQLTESLRINLHISCEFGKSCFLIKNDLHKLDCSKHAVTGCGIFFQNDMS